MSKSNDLILSELSRRLLHRELYRCFDVTAKFDGHGGQGAEHRFRAKLSQAKQERRFLDHDVLEDVASRNPYKRRGYGSPEALEKVYIKRSKESEPEDLSEISDVVRALNEKSIYRVFARSDEIYDQIYQIAEGVGQ